MIEYAATVSGAFVAVISAILAYRSTRRSFTVQQHQTETDEHVSLLELTLKAQQDYIKELKDDRNYLNQQLGICQGKSEAWMGQVDKLRTDLNIAHDKIRDLEGRLGLA